MMTHTTTSRMTPPRSALLVHVLLLLLIRGVNPTSSTSVSSFYTSTSVAPINHNNYYFNKQQHHHPWWTTLPSWSFPPPSSSPRQLQLLDDKPNVLEVPRGGSSKVSDPRQQQPKSERMKLSSDQDRGWPLWFPRTFPSVDNNNNNTSTAPSSSNRQRRRQARKQDVKVKTDTATNNTTEATAENKTTLSPPLLFRRKQSVLLITDNNNETGIQQISSTLSSTTTTTTTTTSNTTTSNNEASATNNKTESVGASQTNETTSTTSTNDQPPNGNETAASESSSPSQQSQQQPSSPGVIVFGSALPHVTPYRIYRRPSLSNLDPTQQQQSTPSTPTPGRFGLNPGTVPSSPNLSPHEAMAVELLGHVVGTLLRLWLIRSLTGWLAKQDELIQPTQHFVWERLNDKFVRDASALSSAITAPPFGISHSKWKRYLHRQRKKQLQQYHQQQQQQQFVQPNRPIKRQVQLQQQLDIALFSRTVLVVDVISDNKNGPDNEYLADLISFVLQQHRQHAFGTNWTTNEPSPLEVLLLIQSPGGSVASFGLAAAQVQRLSREPGITTTVCVDKYAASGGYMIASQGHTLIAAPFASVGSVGVIMEGLNFYEIAKKYGIQPLVLKSGSSKNPITTFGSITKQDIAHQTDQLEKVHVAFKELVVQGRPALQDNLDIVANGNVFLGQEAMALNMVDYVKTSSEYVLERIEAGDRVLKLHRSNPSRFPRRVHLSPLDVLPHLKSFLNGNHRKVVASWFVQGATYLGFLHHLYVTYLR